VNGNSDNHNPLSPEELFRLLETKSEEALSGEDLDDFEREALEGFSAHTSAQKARELTGEVHRRIHEQLTENRKKRPAARIIWLGAAASVVLGLIISAYIITQNAKFSNELALNKQETTDKIMPMPATPAPAETAATIDGELQKQEKEAGAPASATAVEQAQSSAEKTVPGSELHTMLKDGDFNQSKHDAAAGLNLEKSKDEAKKSREQTVSEYELKPAGALEEERSEGYVTNGMAKTRASTTPKEEQVATVPAAPNVQKESQTDADERIRNASVEKSVYAFKKGRKAEEKPNKDAVTTATGSASAEDNKGPLGNSRAAYYTGGEQELKAQIAAWFREHQYDMPKGHYHVRMKVEADGTAQVLEVKAEKHADENALRHLEESLKALKNWNPAMSGQQAAGSETAFTLSF